MPQAVFEKLAQKVEVVSIPINETQKIPAEPMDSLYDWIFFTSVNAVNYFALHQLQPTAKIGAIGNQTACVLKKRGYQVAFQPKEGYSEGLIKEWLALQSAPQRIFWPHSLHARRVIHEQLTAHGHVVLEQVIYKNEFSLEHQRQLQALLREDNLAYALFASPSAWEAFYQTACQSQLPENFWLNLQLAAIGPVTADVIRKAGKTVAIQPHVYDMAHLYQALIKKMEEEKA